MTRIWMVLVAPAGMVVSTTALAQELSQDLIIQPAIPQDLNRGRNVSVREQAHPEYTPLGVTVGGLMLYPRVDAGAGATSNAYLSPANDNAAPFLYQQGAVRLSSNWSRHAFNISASALEREYLGESARNEHLWSASASGRLDVHRTFQIQGDFTASRIFENLFTGEVAPTVAALSQYRRDLGTLKATYTQGRVRSFVLLENANYRFSPVPLQAGGELDQSARNREITRLTGQVEYARSPSVAVFAQLSGTRIQYDRQISPTRPLQASKSARILGGVNVDIAGQLRGSFGVGYGVRDYDAPVYKTLRGLSVEFQLEAFPTQRLTIGLNGRRSIEGDAFGARTSSFTNRVSLRADYEVLRNLIIGGSGEYLDQPSTGSTYRGIATGRYLLSRRMSLQSTASFSRRALESVNEARIDASITYQL